MVDCYGFSWLNDGPLLSGAPSGGRRRLRVLPVLGALRPRAKLKCIPEIGDRVPRRGGNLVGMEVLLGVIVHKKAPDDHPRTVCMYKVAGCPNLLHEQFFLLPERG